VYIESSCRNFIDKPSIPLPFCETTIEPGYEVENQRIAVRFSALETCYSVLLSVQTAVGSHPAPVSLSPEVNRYRYENYHITPSDAEININRAVPPLPPHAFFTHPTGNTVLFVYAGV
jgi:hypothetical protein